MVWCFGGTRSRQCCTCVAREQVCGCVDVSAFVDLTGRSTYTVCSDVYNYFFIIIVTVLLPCVCKQFTNSLASCGVYVNRYSFMMSKCSPNRCLITKKTLKSNYMIKDKHYQVTAPDLQENVFRN